MKVPVAVVGAGIMGAGIAQVASVAGHPVTLFDAVPGAAGRAVESVRRRVESLAAKGKAHVDARDLDLSEAGTLADLVPAGVVVEAVVEDLDAKRRLFAELENVVGDECVLATNTSSLSPTALAAGLRHPQRLVGMHFFNPVPLMRLVEVVPGLATSDGVVAAASDLAGSWGKTVVRSTPTPGFIVNRVARPFYAEAWRLYQEGAAGPATIDAVITGAGGFRMGPFALMDLIGHDVNEAVTRTVWSGFGHDPRFEPSLAQRELVSAGWYGRKSGRGIYDHGPGAAAPAAEPFRECPAPAEVACHGPSALDALIARAGVAVRQVLGPVGTETPAGDRALPAAPVELPSGTLLARCDGTPAAEVAARCGAPVVVVDRCLDDAAATATAIACSEGCPERGVEEAAGLLQAASLDVHLIDDAPGLVVTRTVAMLVNLAADAVHRGVAVPEDVDTAMRLGTNSPVGPLEWGDRWGAGVVVSVLDAMQSAYGDSRYRPSPLLRRRALSGRPLR
ncbi:MAG: 3-hydroxyacyl-CoA dehydrogenase [Acidimicrobiales bacterium]